MRTLCRSAFARAVLALSIAVAVALPFVAGDTGATTIAPNDYNYALNQWAPKTIRANEAWAVTTGDPDVIVAFVDTGIDATHPDLDAHLVPGINVVTGGTNTDDDWAWGGNGSFLAGIVGAETNNTIGVAGINWNVSLLPVKVCSWQFCDISHAAEGIRQAADRGADVINVGIFFQNGSQALADSVVYAQSRGAIVVAPTGNSSMMMMYPGAYPGVVTVGSTSRTDAVVSYSYRGGALDLVAPGEGIVTTAANGNYGSYNGTAGAAAHVSGVLALLRAAGISPGAAVDAVLDGAADLGAPGWDPDYGAGRLDACGALDAAGVSCSGAPTATATTVRTSTPSHTPVPATPTRTPTPQAATATPTNTFVTPGMSPTPTTTTGAASASPTRTSTPSPTRTSTPSPTRTTAPQATATPTWTSTPPAPSSTPTANCPQGKKKNRRC